MGCGGAFQTGGVISAAPNPALISCPDGYYPDETGKCVSINRTPIPAVPVNPATPLPTMDPQQTGPQGGADREGPLNRGETPKTPEQDQYAVDPRKKKPNPVDPYFAFRGFTNGLAWLSGIVDRRRQNQYMQAQFNQLGQQDPMPVENFQPNAFSLYAKYGGSLKKFQTGGAVHKGKQVGFDQDMVYVDKGKGKIFFYDDKGNLQEKEALTGKNRQGHLLNPYTSLNTASEDQKDADKITPIGVFPLSKVRDIYGSPGLDIMGTSDKRGQSIALHTTYNPVYRNQFYYNKNVEDNAQSYGCINCNKAESDKIAKMYANKKVYIYDSNLSDENNQKYNAVNNLISGDNSLYKKLASTFNQSKLVSYREGNDGKLYGKNAMYDPATQTLTNEATDLKEVVIRSGKARKGISPSPAKQQTPTAPSIREIIQQAMATSQAQPARQAPVRTSTPVQSQEINNPSIVDFLNASGQNASFKSRAVLAKQNGIEGYKGTADQNLKLLAMLRGTDSPSARKMAKGGRFMGINPEHKGWCTPMSKSTCTGARRRLALTLKKHHGFHE